MHPRTACRISRQSGKTVSTQSQSGRSPKRTTRHPMARYSRHRKITLPPQSPAGQHDGLPSRLVHIPRRTRFRRRKIDQLLHDLPKFTDGLVRAKGVFQVLGTWVWLNWVDGQWGANQVSWRRDSRFELIAKSFDADLIEKKLQEALEK